jgi:hypothetical protein
MEVISFETETRKNASRVLLREILPVVLLIMFCWFAYTASLNVQSRYGSSFYATSFYSAYGLVINSMLLMFAALHLLQVLIYPPLFVATDDGLSKSFSESTLKFDWQEIEKLSSSGNSLCGTSGITMSAKALEKAKSLSGSEFLEMKVEHLLANLFFPTLWLEFPRLLATSDLYDLMVWNKKALDYHLKINWYEINRPISDFNRILLAFKPNLEMQKPSNRARTFYVFLAANVLLPACAEYFSRINHVMLPPPLPMLGLALFIAGATTLTLFAISDIQNRVRLAKS